MLLHNLQITAVGFFSGFHERGRSGPYISLIATAIGPAKEKGSFHYTQGFQDILLSQGECIPFNPS